MAHSEIPLSVVTALLETANPAGLQYVLKSLYSSTSSISQASKTDLAHLTSRITNLLNARDDRKKWYATHVIQILAANPIILTAAGSTFIVALLKIINDDSTVSLNFTNASLALDAIIKGIRGKPVLTREILTPNLPSTISSFISNLEKDVITILPILSQLLLKNTTTFKPFINKFEVKLVRLLTDNFHNLNKSLQRELCKAYAYLNLIKPNQQQRNGGGQNIQSLPDDQWRAKIIQVLSELKLVVALYENLVDLKEEQDLVDLLEQLPKSSEVTIFPFLQIDLSESITIIEISKRINVLTEILIALITSPTPFAIRVPLGLIIQAANLLLSISTNYIPFKRELRHSPDLQNVIVNDISKTQAHGANLIYEITRYYKKLVLPHLPYILASLEVAIPVKNENGKKVIKINEESALAIESELLTIIRTTTELLNLFNGLNEYELINKLIEVSLVLLKKRTPLDGLLDKKSSTTEQQPPKQKNQRNKKRKNKDSTPMADLLSHSELFESDPARATITTISRFFEVVLVKVPGLSSSFRVKVVKYVISTAVKQQCVQGEITASMARLLEVLVLYPNDGEVFSVLPIVKTLLPNNERLSLLTSPRFPILDTKYRPRQHLEEQDDDVEEEDEEEEDVRVGGETPVEEDKIDYLQELKTRQVDIPVQPQVFKSNEEVKTLQFATEQAEEAKTRALEDEEDEEDTPSKRIKIVQTEAPNEVKVQVTKQEEDDDSDFEIPDIAIDSEDSGEE